MTSVSIQELIDNDEVVEVTAADFDMFGELFRVPDYYVQSKNYQGLKAFICNNYRTDLVDDFDGAMKKAILSYLATSIKKEGTKLYAYYDAKDILKYGWKNAILCGEHQITDLFLAHACSDKPYSTLPRKQ